MKFLRLVLLGAIVAAIASCGGGGVGSGGTGLTAGGGGVGSGGTGISPVFTIGPITGFGSIIVNGVEYDISGASVSLHDASDLKLGMTVEVEGTVNADFTIGTATRVISAADLRGPVANVDSIARSFDVLGTTVTTDEATIFDGVAGVSALVPGDTVQVYGLIEGSSSVRASRIEKLGAAALPVLSGTVANLDKAAQTFTLGSQTVNYSGAPLVGAVSVANLANGMQLRVRSAAGPLAGVLQATQVQAWHSAVRTEGEAASIGGAVADYSSLASFTVLGTPVDASAAQITGGSSDSIGNGVKVEVSGFLHSGVLVASKIKISQIPGAGGPALFQFSGTIGSYVSQADFRVNGNPVDASGSGVVFSGGIAADLGNGKKVTIMGSQVVDGALIADQVTFAP